MNHEKTHRQFMNWTDWLVIAISIVVTIVLGIWGSTGVITELESILTSLIAIFIGAVIILHKTSTKIMQNTITDLQNAIGEDINTIVALRGDITMLLKDIIYKITDKKTKADNIDRATKRLNGVKQILKTDMVERDMAKAASDDIKVCKSSFSAVSTLAIAECLEPAFFEYFVVQMCKSAIMNELKNNNFSAERYFVYDHEIIDAYREELETFKRLHEEVGKIKFIVFDAEIIRSNVSAVLAKLNSEDKKCLEKEDNPFSWPLSGSNYIPDFILIDESSVYVRNEDGIATFSRDQEKCDYYISLLNFFREADALIGHVHL